MCQYIEAAAVRHAEQGHADIVTRRVGDDLVQHGNHHIQPFDGEASLARVQAVEENLKRLYLRQPLEQLPAVHALLRRAEATGLGGSK